MKSIVQISIFACLMLTAGLSFGQDEKIYHVVERMPQFPGGAESMGRFVGRMLKYPPDAKADVVIRVAASFVVNEDGSITNAKITKSAGAEFDAAVLKVIEAMPKWVAGREKGNKVKCILEVPFKFDRQVAADN